MMVVGAVGKTYREENLDAKATDLRDYFISMIAENRVLSDERQRKHEEAVEAENTSSVLTDDHVDMTEDRTAQETSESFMLESTQEEAAIPQEGDQVPHVSGENGVVNQIQEGNAEETSTEVKIEEMASEDKEAKEEEEVNEQINNEVKNDDIGQVKVRDSPNQVQIVEHSQKTVEGGKEGTDPTTEGCDITPDTPVSLEKKEKHKRKRNSTRSVSLVPEEKEKEKEKEKQSRSGTIGRALTRKLSIAKRPLPSAPSTPSTFSANTPPSEKRSKKRIPKAESDLTN